MARGIYGVELKQRYFPALTEAEALEMQNQGDCALREDEVKITLAVKEEDTVKLFILAKTMYETEKFEYNEVEVAVRALARELGYFSNAEEVADCVITWTERLGDDMSIEDMFDWLIG